MFTVVESIVVVVPSTFKLPVTVTLPVSVGFDGIPIVTVWPETEVSISLVVPAKVKSCVFSATEPLPLEPLISNVLATPVRAEPSPMNEPVKSDVPPTSPKSSPLILPLPKSVAWFDNPATICAEPDIVPVPPAIVA